MYHYDDYIFRSERDSEQESPPSVQAIKEDVFQDHDFEEDFEEDRFWNGAGIDDPE